MASVRWILPLAVIGVAPGPVWGQVDTAPEGLGVSFALPKEWKVARDEDRVILTAKDGTVYRLCRHTVAADSGDSTRGVASRTLAEEHAGTLLTVPRFERSDSLQVPGGRGATFQFRGKAQADGPDSTVVVWTGAVGNQAVIVMPETVTAANHAEELWSVLRSLSIRALPKTAGAAGERNRYEGKILSNPFTLQLMHDGSAAMEWRSRAGRSTFTGDYIERGGTTTVKLNQASGSNRINASDMRLDIRGTASARFRSSSSLVSGDVADLKLTAVDVGKGSGRGKRC